MGLSVQDAASRTNAVGGRALGAFYGAAALVLSAPLLLPGWSTVDRSLLAGLVVAAALVGAIVLVVDHHPSPWLTHLLTGLATMIIGSALLAGGGGAASATFSVLFVWVVVHAVVNLSRRGAAVQVGLAALIQAACLVAVGEGGEAAAEVTVTLAVAVSTAVCVAALLHRAREAAGLDDLTGLLNRRGLERALDTALALSRRTGDQTSVLVLDLDGFKAINDSHGHAAGDRALIAVASAWSRELAYGRRAGSGRRRRVRGRAE